MPILYLKRKDPKFENVFSKFLRTLMTKHKEKGTVTTIRMTDKAVRRNAVNPKPSESSIKRRKIVVE